jgi:hypothetical protein
MPNNPLQVVLNTKDYFVTPDGGRFGPAKDFFEGRDHEFVEHRDKLLRQVSSIASAFERSKVSAGVVKVSLNREAWAKSHRPQRALFPLSKRPCVGASQLGELYYHVTTDDVAELGQEIATAETETRRKISSKSGKEYVAPSYQRSDVGAVEAIELPSAIDKRSFSPEEAVRWLSDPRTAGAYFVELFSLPPTYFPELVADYLRQIVIGLVSTAEDRGLPVETFDVDIKGGRAHRPTGVVGIRLLDSKNKKSFNRSVDEHSRLLSLLDVHPYVRRIILPPIIVAANVRASAIKQGNAPGLPRKNSGVKYPKIGIIDGGVGDHLGEWRIGDHTVVAPSHRHTAHGSSIAGLLVGGQSLNGSDVCSEADGCEVFDICILPDTDKNVFDTYYPNGIRDFLVELDAGVEAGRRDEGIRIFNISLNLQNDPVQGDGYGVVASLIDLIADKHDVVFVISAGNLRPADCRPEWPADSQTALQHLASRIIPETLLQPAESSRSIAVGALNPPGCDGRVPGVPTTYTRRGPGVRVGVKPDVGHYGGCLPDARTPGGGLRSWAEDATVVNVHGTSYAAPLVAKTLAALDARITSHLSREMLLGLLIHGCELPHALSDPALKEVAKQFTGFGIPARCDEMLQTPDHAITLVFSDVLPRKRELEFDFAWPKSLVDPSTGACRGDIRMTLVYRPVINREFGAEFVRVNIDAHLRQESKDKYVSRVRQAFLPDGSEGGHFEHELIEHGLKWWPIKAYRANFPKGIGKSSNWRLTVKSLIRSEEMFPAAGVPFGLLLTIADVKRTEPVFSDLRLHLKNRNVQLSDIRASAQVRVQP